jgi:hypothetical protein
MRPRAAAGPCPLFSVRVDPQLSAPPTDARSNRRGYSVRGRKIDSLLDLRLELREHLNVSEDDTEGALGGQGLSELGRMW